MGAYILRRIATAIPVLLAVSFVTFLVLNVIPGDPAEIILGQNATPEAIADLRNQLGLNQPVIIQYLQFLGHAFRGDLGTSYTSSRTVSGELARTWPATFVLAVSAMAIAGVFGIVFGVLGAVFQNSVFDRLIQILVLVGFSMPTYWLGLLLTLFFALRLGWFPTSGFGSPAALVLPAVTLSVWSLAAVLRMTRSSMLEVLSEDFIRVARSRGIPRARIYTVHALRPALNPVITILGLQFGQLLTGAVLTEMVFNWPGVGRLMINSVYDRDFPMIRGVVLTAALVFVVVNLITDILYTYADPRVRNAGA